MEGLDIGRYTIPAEELEEMFETSGGPGGQHANRTATAVRLRFDVKASSLPEEARKMLVDRFGEVVEVTASKSRSQFRNRALARQQMRERLERALKPKPKRRPTKPTRASKRRRVADKRAKGEKKRLRQPPQIDD
jgi:ribosome-associated protein